MQLGTYSPIHAHGAVKENKRRIYSRLYQAAAEKWVKQGILSHAIALYAHNNEAVKRVSAVPAKIFAEKSIQEIDGQNEYHMIFVALCFRVVFNLKLLTDCRQL